MQPDTYDRWALVRRPRFGESATAMDIAHLGGASLGVMYLWALALEIDERRATRTGERVCRACGGRGKVDAWGRWQSGGGVCDPSGAPPPTSYADGRGDVRNDASNHETRWRVTKPCYHNAPTRPDTISLHRMVERRACSPPPDEHPASYEPMAMGDIPARWLVDLDAMESAGWAALVLPSTKADGFDHVTPAWQARWWRAWFEWVRGGVEPDADVLARDLRQLLPAPEAREEAKGLKPSRLRGKSGLAIFDEAVATELIAVLESIAAAVRVSAGSAAELSDALATVGEPARARSRRPIGRRLRRRLD